MEIAKFGRIVITGEGIEIHYNVREPYFIAAGRLWEYQERGRSNEYLWDWPIHLIEKTWFTREDMLNFNTAFFFARDYFKEQKPKDLPYISNAQTLFIQDQMKTNHDNISRIPVPEGGISVFEKSPEQEEWERKCAEVRKPIEYLEI